MQEAIQLSNEALQIAEKEEKQKEKWLSDEILQLTEERREAKGKREKERYI